MDWMRIILVLVFLGLVETQAPADMPPTTLGQTEGMVSTQPWMRTTNSSIKTENEEGNREGDGETVSTVTDHMIERQESTSHMSSSKCSKTINHPTMSSTTADSSEISAYTEDDSTLDINTDSNATNLYTSITDTDAITVDGTITDTDKDYTTIFSDDEDGTATISDTTVIPPHVDGTTSTAVTTNKGSTEEPRVTTISEEQKSTTNSVQTVSDKEQESTMSAESTTGSLTTGAVDNTTLPTKSQSHDHSGGVLIPTVVCLIVVGLLFFCGYVWFTKIRSRYGDRQLLINEDELSNTQFFDFPL